MLNSSNLPGTPSLDQLKIFLTVVDSGSFVGAGRLLGRATSAISYGIANLELQLGVLLFDRNATRKPKLTEAGKALLAEARSVSLSVDTLRARIKGLLQGLETEVSLAVEVLFSTERLVDALRAFEAQFPTVTLRLHIEALGGVSELVQTGRAGIGISGPLHGNYADITAIQVGTLDLIPVAAPQHPMAHGGKPRDHVQLVLSDRSKLTEGQDFGVLGLKTWRLGDLGSKYALLLAGVGWGNMPEPMVRADIRAGRLIQLKLPEWDGGVLPFHAIHRTDAPPGPAASWLIERFVSQARR